MREIVLGYASSVVDSGWYLDVFGGVKACFYADSDAVCEIEFGDST